MDAVFSKTVNLFEIARPASPLVAVGADGSHARVSRPVGGGSSLGLGGVTLQGPEWLG